MIENMPVHEIARAWVDTLTARGVTLVPRGKSLVMVPKSAYSAMSNEERETLKTHKAAILEAVRERLDTAQSRTQLPTLTPDCVSIVAPVAPVPPTPCPYCYQSPCIGVEHPVFYTLHPESAQAREDARLNHEFRLAFGLDT